MRQKPKVKLHLIEGNENKYKTGSFMKVYDSLFDYEEFTINDILVYSALRAYGATNKLVTSVTTQVLSKRVKLSEKSVYRALDHLKELGVIESTYDPTIQRRQIKILRDFAKDQPELKEWKQANPDLVALKEELDKIRAGDFDHFK